MAKTHDHTPYDQALAAAKAAGPMIDWLMEKHQIEFELVTGFLYPGHSRLRMHGPKSRTERIWSRTFFRRSQMQALISSPELRLKIFMSIPLAA